jgi:predicted lactoylglutathione lyase
MDQRVSFITLDYRDYQRARGFYTTMGWTNPVAPDDEVVFFQAGGMIVGLWDRAKLTADVWGGYSSIFVDPEGHPWEVAHNPACTLNDDGTISL